MPNEDLHNQIMHELGEIKGEIKGTNRRLDIMNGTMKDHSKRIRANETGLAVIKTKAGIIGGFAGFAIIAVWEFVRSQFK